MALFDKRSQFDKVVSKIYIREFKSRKRSTETRNTVKFIDICLCLDIVSGYQCHIN